MNPGEFEARLLAEWAEYPVIAIRDPQGAHEIVAWNEGATWIAPAGDLAVAEDRCRVLREA